MGNGEIWGNCGNSYIWEKRSDGLKAELGEAATLELTDCASEDIAADIVFEGMVWLAEISRLLYICSLAALFDIVFDTVG